MKTSAGCWLAAGCALILVACGDDSGGQGDGRDANDVGPVDSGNDSLLTPDLADHDAANDAEPDVADDVPADVVADVPSDMGRQDAEDDTPVEDVAEDLPMEDAFEDAAQDVGEDGNGSDVDPYVAGDESVSTVNLSVTLSDGVQRAMPVYVPNTSNPPVVVFNPGTGIRGDRYTGFCERLASHGIACVLADYGDDFFSLRTHVQLEDDLITTIDALDASATSGALSGLVDNGTLGVAGHSRGGKQATMATTIDGRIDALVGVDAVDSTPPFVNPADYPSVVPERASQITVPTAWIGAGRANSGEGINPACAPPDEDADQYYASSPSPSWLFVMPEAGHNDFLDDLCANRFALECGACTEGAAPSAARDVALATTTAFFAVQLLGDDRYAPFLEVGAFSDVGITVQRQAR